jgi:hypothetical protein
LSESSFELLGWLVEELHASLVARSRAVPVNSPHEQLLRDPRFEVASVGTYRISDEVGLHLTVRSRSGDDGRAYAWLLVPPAAGLLGPDEADDWLGNVLTELVEEFQSHRPLTQLVPVTWAPGAFD